MKCISNHKCCNVRESLLKEDIIMLMYPLSQEIYDAFPDTLKVCTKMCIIGMTLHNANDTQSDDDIIGNNMEPINNITDRDIPKENIYH